MQRKWIIRATLIHNWWAQKSRNLTDIGYYSALWWYSFWWCGHVVQNWALVMWSCWPKLSFKVRQFKACNRFWRSFWESRWSNFDRPSFKMSIDMGTIYSKCLSKFVINRREKIFWITDICPFAKIWTNMLDLWTLTW